MTDMDSQVDDLPAAIVEAVKASLDRTHAAFFSEKPTLTADQHDSHNDSCVAGIISFVGDLSWSLSWIIARDTAPQLAQRFAGFEIPFESPDMGDVAGELVNVIAGEIVAQLDQRKIKAQMSLPTIARGSPLELVPGKGPSIINLEYRSREGPFWFRLATAKHRSARLPGKQ
jgi:CheY-specific phosphatase CheX